MFPHCPDAPCTLEGLDALEGVIDIVYNPARTGLMLEAERRGIPCIGGLLMLVAQAAQAVERYTGKATPRERILDVTEHLSRREQNIALIGMPGSGKSTVGVVLAKRLGRRFVDSDLVIQDRHGKLLHELITEYGVEGFWQIESDVNASLDLENSIIATGGSACYEPEGMQHLREISTVVYLKLPYEEVEKRLGDLNARGVTLQPGQTLRDLYDERTPLYEKYADLIIDCNGKMLRDVVAEIAEKYKKQS